jgi:hypothetical protein
VYVVLRWALVTQVTDKRRRHDLGKVLWLGVAIRTALATLAVVTQQ